MSEHKAKIEWQRDSEFTYEAYTRNHSWDFPNGVSVPASAAERYRGDPTRVDPEAGLVACLSSCHMLTFLALAARAKLIVDHYEDDASGWLEKNEAGKLAVTRVTLRPRITFSGEAPDAAALSALHHRAHEECFIASSVKTKVTVEAALAP